MDKKVWYIAAPSKGLGLALVHQLLTNGHRVAATSRLLPALVEATGGNITDDFLPLEVDSLEGGSVAESIRTTLVKFGRIDVVVNNAGLAATDGAVTVIPQALPHLQLQGHGHIIDITAFESNNIAMPAGTHLTTVTRDVSDHRRLDEEPADTLYVSIDGRQIADPVKAAAALIRLTTLPEPPSLLVFASHAFHKAATIPSGPDYTLLSGVTR